MHSPFNVGEGGALHRMENRARLTSLPRQVMTALAVTWLPLLALGLVTETFFGRAEPMLREASVHVRLLVATPVFLMLDRVFTHACRSNLEQLVAEGFVRSADGPRLQALVRGARRLSDAMLPEVVMASLALVLGAAGLSRAVSIGGLPRSDAATAAQAWYALVGWPLFQFLLWRSLWRWMIWARILVGLSRIDLALVPTHADRRAGIGFLSQPSVDYCAMLLFAISSVLSAEWGHDLRFSTLGSFEPILVASAVIGASVAFGPLLAFAPRLERARRAGLVENAGIATALGRRFRRDWLAERDSQPAVRADPGPLALMIEIQRNTVERLEAVLFYKRQVILLLVATLLPIVPLIVMHIPRDDWTVLLKLLTGGRLR